MTTLPEAPDPIRVMLVELTEPLSDVDSQGRYASAFLVLLRNGVPVGHMIAPTGIAADDLRTRIDDLVGGIAPAPVPALTDAPFISVVVPSTFEREDLLLGCVAALVRQDYPSYEIIVVDNRPSADHAPLIQRLTSYPGVSVVAQPLRGSSAARNRGIEAARGEVITFADDDIEVTPGYLAAIGRSFAADPDVACVTGLLLPRELETPSQIWFERSGSIVGHTYARTVFRRRPGSFDVVAAPAGDAFSIYRAGHFGTGANMSFRADVIRSLGGFDVVLGAGVPALGGEEQDLFVRLLFAGHALAFDPQVFTLHTHLREYEVLRRTMFAYGCGYTGMLTGLIWSDRRHLLGLSAYALRAVSLLARKFGGRRQEAVAARQYPKELSRAEFRGLMAGPWRYLTSRRTLRRWKRSLAQDAVTTP